jgi:hypothetical protein
MEPTSNPAGQDADLCRLTECIEGVVKLLEPGDAIRTISVLTRRGKTIEIGLPRPAPAPESGRYLRPTALVWDGVPHALSPIQYAILARLWEPRQEPAGSLAKHVWGRAVPDRTVRSALHRLNEVLLRAKCDFTATLVRGVVRLE